MTAGAAKGRDVGRESKGHEAADQRDGAEKEESEAAERRGDVERRLLWEREVWAMTKKHERMSE